MSEIFIEIQILRSPDQKMSLVSLEVWTWFWHKGLVLRLRSDSTIVSVWSGNSGRALWWFKTTWWILVSPDRGYVRNPQLCSKSSNHVSCQGASVSVSRDISWRCGGSQQHFFPLLRRSRSLCALMLTVSFSRSRSRSARLWLCFLARSTMWVNAMNIWRETERSLQTNASEVQLED